MDIDCLTTDQRTNHMKKGLCFECHQYGHRAADHRNGTNINTPTPARVPMKGKDAYQKIRALIADLDEEEKEVAIKNMEEEGF